MCFLCGKGDRNIQFIEITNSEPFIVEGLKYSGDQTKGACLVPKRAMDVMQGEVNRVLQLCDTSIVPVTWQVPRKSYRDYHADIYPETNGLEPGMGPENWIQGENVNPPKINLDPKKRPKENLVVFRDASKLQEIPRLIETSSSSRHSSSNGHSNGVSNGNGSHKVETESAVEEKADEVRNVVNVVLSSCAFEVFVLRQLSTFVKPLPKPRAVARSNSNSSTESPRKKPTPPTKPRPESNVRLITVY